MSAETAQAAGATSKPKPIESVTLVAHPKIIFMWPTWLIALAAAIFLSVVGDQANSIEVVTWTFLIVLGVNLVVLGFDFPRTTSLTLFFLGVALVLAAVLLVVYVPNILPAVTNWITGIHPRANATFYWLISIVLTVIFVLVLLNRRFDYWEVRSNELLHHHGILSDLERVPSPHLRVEKEINDVFEFLLLGSGRLILHPSGDRKAIVLDNVPWISHKEREITRLLGALQVKVRTED
jgi:hypothetical protein